MTANVSMPKKTSASTFILYGILALFIILACWVLGAAMDLSVNASGKVDISALQDASDTLAVAEKIMGGTYVQSLVGDERQRREAKYIPNELKADK